MRKIYCDNVFIALFIITISSRDVCDVVHKVVAVGSRSAETAQNFIKDVAAGDPSIRAYGTYEGVYGDKASRLDCCIRKRLRFQSQNVDAVYIGSSLASLDIKRKFKYYL